MLKLSRAAGHVLVDVRAALHTLIHPLGTVPLLVNIDRERLTTAVRLGI
jgi:hypothetical protein